MLARFPLLANLMTFPPEFDLRWFVPVAPPDFGHLQAQLALRQPKSLWESGWPEQTPPLEGAQQFHRQKGAD